jgi:hypothetical protein
VSTVRTTVVQHSYYLYLGLSTSSKEDLFAKTSFDRMSRYDAQSIATLVLSTHCYMSHFSSIEEFFKPYAYIREYYGE